MTMPIGLRTYLEKTHIKYSLVSHVPARSSQYAASLLHLPGKEVAKTVVLRAGKRFLLAVLPGSYHINLEKLAVVVGAPVELVGEQECHKLFPDCQPGAVPPFGEVYGLPVYLDDALSENPEIIFCAGTLTESIRMRYADLVRLAIPRICSFAERGEIAGEKAMADLVPFEEGGGK
ncbi:MAG: YbaK/EbsC family protein [Acidobacteriia bacterium]|nr:YbaK/EbsC family protein [Terriglobia bacterium]